MKIVDVGCGEFPFKHADVFVDRDRNLLRHGRPFIVADISALPFRDNAFSFVWCSHTLEHVDDPKAACAELVRIGKAGRIFTPTWLREYLHPERNHQWIVSPQKGVLVFERKPEVLHKPVWLEVMKVRAVQSTKNDFEEWQLRVVFDWQDTFVVEVIQ